MLQGFIIFTILGIENKLMCIQVTTINTFINHLPITVGSRTLYLERTPPWADCQINFPNKQTYSITILVFQVHDPTGL